MTEGSPMALLLRFAIPMMIGNLFQQMYNVVDAAVIGRFVGGNELGGIGATGSIHYLIFSLGYGMASGIGIRIGMLFGAGEDKRVTRAIYNSFYVLLGAAFLITLLGACGADAILKLMQTPEEVFPHAVQYLRVCMLGSGATLLYAGISGMMRALGDSKTPLYILIAACLLNIGLDCLFVLVWHWNVFGVALATIVAQAFAAVLSYVLARRTFSLFAPTKDALRPDRKLILSCMRLGLPIAGQNGLIALSCIVLQVAVNGFGHHVVTAFTAVSQMDQLIQQPYGSLSASMSAYAAQNIGAGKPKRVREGLRASAGGMIVFTAAAFVLIRLFAREMLSLFVTDEAVMEIALHAWRMTSLFYPFLGLLYVVRGTLNGLGDSIYAGMNGVIEFVCRICMAKPLTLLPGVGLYGCFLCSCFTWMITGVLSFLRYQFGRWDPEKRRRKNDATVVGP